MATKEEAYNLLMHKYLTPEQQGLIQRLRERQHENPKMNEEDETIQVPTSNSITFFNAITKKQYDTIDPKALKGKQLYYYFASRHSDPIISNSIGELAYAVKGDNNKFICMLEKVVMEDKKLCAVYRNLGETPSEGMIYIGEIEGGGLYMK